MFARVLALHVAHYQNKYGTIPVEESLQLMLTEAIDDDQAKMLADGFEVLITVMKSLATLPAFVRAMQSDAIEVVVKRQNTEAFLAAALARSREVSQRMRAGVDALTKAVDPHSNRQQ